MRADRLLSMIMILQNRGKVTAQELAAELEVSVRTVHRDVIALSIAGVPVYTIRGPGGGIALVEKYRSDLTGLTKDEVRALFMMSVPPAIAELGLDQQFRAAFLKLAAGLPSSLRDDEQEVRQRIHIDPTPWDDQPELDDVSILMTLQKSLWECQVLDIRYHSWMRPDLDPMKTLFNPYGLVAKSGRWYLIGKRIDHIAVIRVDLIVDIVRVGVGFDRPDEFDLVEFWQGYCQLRSENRPKFPVLALVEESLLPMFSWYLGDAISYTLFDEKPGDLQGKVRVEILFEFFEQALRVILSMGGAVEVIKPMSLRYSVKDYAEQILRVYQ